MRNVDLILKVANKIETDPNNYYQGSWFCGTSACVAGHAAILAGAKVHRDSNFSGYVGVNGFDILVCSFAQDQLGLTEDEAEWLFAEWRTEECMPKILYMLAAGEDLETLNAFEADFVNNGLDSL